MKTDGAAKEPKNKARKRDIIYFCKILWPVILKMSDIRVFFQLLVSNTDVRFIFF